MIDVSKLGQQMKIHPHHIQYSHKRKTIALKVDKNGLTVLAPHRCRISLIETLIAQKAAWIQKHLATYEAAQQHKPSFIHGSTLFFQGQMLTLNIVTADTFTCHVSASHLDIHTPNEDPHFIHLKLNQWLKREAQRILPPLTHEYAALLGKTVNRIRLGRFKSKWGSCHHDGTIKYNWLLMQAPLFVMEYVVCHEVSHLVEPNHSARFWAVVERICPDYRAAKKWLKDNGPILMEQ